MAGLQLQCQNLALSPHGKMHSGREQTFSLEGCPMRTSGAAYMKVPCTAMTRVEESRWAGSQSDRSQKFYAGPTG